MQEIICYTPYLSEGTERYIDFMKLLLDDNWANGEIIFPEEIYSAIGNINTRLSAKQNYEFLLRATQKYPLKAIGVSSAAIPPTAISSSDLLQMYHGMTIVPTAIFWTNTNGNFSTVVILIR